MRTVNLIGSTSRTLSKAEELAKTFHIQNIYNSVDDLTNNCALDGVLVLVSADQIYNVAKKLLPLGVPTFLEKPPGILLNETQSLAELADKHGTKNIVGYNRRYYSIFHKGQKIIENEGNLLGLEVEGHERFWRIADRSITQKVIEMLADTESRAILFSIIRRGKTAAELSQKYKIPLSSVYKKISDLEELTLLKVDSWKISDSGRKFKIYKSRIKNAEINIKKPEVTLILTPNVE